MIAVTSSTAQESSAEIIEISIRNLLAVIFLMRSIKLTIQAKKPVSFKRPTRTIIPTKNKITSREEYFKTFSKSMVLVINKNEVPKKAKVRRKLQKKSVPNMDKEKMAIEVAWREFKPIRLLRKNKLVAIAMMVKAFFSNLPSP